MTTSRFAISCALCVFAMSAVHASDSTGVPPMQSVGYSAPNAKHAASASRALRANNADHADTASKLASDGQHQSDDANPRVKMICSAKGARKCRKAEPLPPGTYFVSCYPVGEDRAVSYSIVVSGIGDRKATCPLDMFGGAGITGFRLILIKRIS